MAIKSIDDLTAPVGMTERENQKGLKITVPLEATNQDREGMDFLANPYPIQIEFGSSPIKFLNLLGQWCVLKNEISSFFGEHQSWSIYVCIGYIGHG